MPIITQPVFTKSGLIRYQSVIQQPVLNTSNPTLHNLCRLIQDQPLEFSLQFSGIYAHYRHVDKGELQDFELQFLLSILQFKETKINYKLHQVATKHHSKWIVSEMKHAWKITGDTRIFSGYLLEHAESYLIIKRHLKSDYSLRVNAWFCRSLPYFFGPMGFYGLPGLILILEMDKVSLKAIDVQIDVDFSKYVFWDF
jgi:GLPGLI family protein